MNDQASMEEQLREFTVDERFSGGRADNEYENKKAKPRTMDVEMQASTTDVLTADPADCFM
jgi:hypothetical protein